MSTKNIKHQQKRFRPKFRLKKGDQVVVNSGEYKGAEGRILSVDTKKERAIVEGVNLITKHAKPSAKFPDGGRIEMEAPIRLCKLMLVDPKSGEPTRVGRKVQDGKIVRYAKKSGEILK